MTTSARREKKVKDQDTELINAINAGRTELFQELVGRYEQKLYNFALRMCGDVCDAEDLVQETFLTAFRYLKDFRFETKFKNWLYRIATSACIKKRRKSKYAPERELSLDEYAAENESATTENVPDWAQVPLEQLLSEELSIMIQEAILSLPEKYRIVIILRDLEGFSTIEAAQILSLKESNVKVRLHRARLYLRDKLKGYFEHAE
ncbi:MAG TPA: RNA polymerase sigma factor [Desulfobacterales bacterium]